MGSFSLKGLLNNALKDIAASNEGSLYVEIDGASTSVFGDHVTVDQVPLIQGDFIGTTINTQRWASGATGTGATADTNFGRFRLVSGTTSSTGSSYIKSTLPARYRAGQGITTRFTYSWANSAAGNYHLVGMGVLDSGVTTGSGTNTWYATTTPGDGYFIGYAGTSFGLMHRNSAASATNSIETFTAQANWNVDKLDGTGQSGINWSDKSVAYPLQLRYPYLGHDNVKWYIQHPENGRWTLFHVIKYAGTSAIPQLRNPSLNFWAHNYNLAGTTSTTGYLTCASVFLNGVRAFTGPQFGFNNVKTGVTTETNIFSIRNATTFNGMTNQGMIRLRSMGIASVGGSAVVKYRIISNTTLGGSPAFTAISGTASNPGTSTGGVTITAGQSIASVDTAGTTISGGMTRFNAATTGASSEFIDLTQFELFIMPGEVFTFSVTTTSAAGAVVTVNWNEDV